MSYKNKIMLMLFCIGALRASNQELAIAIQRGDVNAARTLLKNNALMEAVRTGDACRVQMLIAAGADVNTINVIGFTPLWCAVNSGHTQITQMLVNVPGIAIDDAILHVAAENGNIATIQTLIAADAYLDAVILGNTALKWAIAREHFAAAREFLRAGISLQNLNEAMLTRLRTELAQEDRDLVERAIATPDHQRYIREYQRLKRNLRLSRTSTVKALCNRELNGGNLR